MPGNGFPKLIFAYSEARIYSTPDGSVALFWRGRPVALFDALEPAMSYMAAEFDSPKDGETPWTE